MISQVSVINARGESYTFSLKDPSTSGFFIEDIDGLFPPTAEVLSTVLAGADGSYVNDVRAQNRNIVFTFGILSGMYTDVETLRRKLYRIFPIKGQVTLRVYDEKGNRFDTSGYVESNEVEIWTKQQKAVVSIICNDPYFINGLSDDAGSSGWITSYLGPSIGGFEFPFSDDESPSLELSQNRWWPRRHIIDNPGTVDDGAVFKFLVGVDGLGIWVRRMDETWKTEYELMYLQALTDVVGTGGYLAGDLVTISTMKGDKYATLVRDGVEYDVIGYTILGSAFKWVSLPPGRSYIEFTTSSPNNGLPDLHSWVIYKPKYEGV